MSTLGQNGSKTGIMVALMVGVFLSPLNVNLTSVALPTIRDHFSVSVDAVAWVGTAYFIPMVVMMPLFAAVGERWGPRRIYGLGFALLSLGGFASAFAPNLGWLLATRVLQGIGWSGLYPLALILIREHFPARRQGEVMGTWESAVGGAAIIGPIVGGALVDFLSWQTVYIFVGLVAALGLVLTIISVPPRQPRTEPSKPSSFDWTGALSLTSAMLLILLGLSRQIPLLLGVGGIAAVVWWWSAGRSPNPFIDPTIFRNRRFVTASGAATLRMTIGLAALMSLPLFLEDVQQLSPSIIGIILPIYSLFLFFGARPGGKWADRAGGRQPSIAGFVLMTIGVALLIFLDTRISIVLIIVALVVRGIGAGVSQVPFAQIATSSTDEHLAGMAAGMYGMLRYSGLALGSALVGIVLDTRFRHYQSDGTGISAVSAYHELFAILTLIGLVGLALSWLIGSSEDQTPEGPLVEGAYG